MCSVVSLGILSKAFGGIELGSGLKNTNKWQSDLKIDFRDTLYSSRAAHFKVFDKTVLDVVTIKNGTTIPGNILLDVDLAVNTGLKKPIQAFAAKWVTETDKK